MVAPQRKTVADFEALDVQTKKGHELIEGQVVGVEPVGGRHGMVEVDIAYYLRDYAEKTGIGEVFSSATHFVISAERGMVMKPDVAFVRAERMPQDDVWSGVVPIVPDLAVEVVSSPIRPEEPVRRVGYYGDGGVRQVWVVRPIPATVTVFTPGGPERVLTIDDTLDGGEVLPGFALPLRRIFRRRRSLHA